MNAGEKLKRLEEKQAHSKKFSDYIRNLQSKKPVIIGGDLNVAHTENDLARPKTNSKTPGFTPQERQDFTNLINDCNLVDTYRSMHPNTFEKYTYYSFRFNCRQKNIGYFILTWK